MKRDDDPHAAKPRGPSAEVGPRDRHAELARGLLADLGGGHARVEVRETDGHLAAAAEIPAHRPPRAHETPEPVPAVMLGSTEPLGRRIREDLRDDCGEDLPGSKTVVSVRRRHERRQVVVGIGAGVALAVVILVAVFALRGEGGGSDAGVSTGSGTGTGTGTGTGKTAAVATEAVPVTPAPVEVVPSTQRAPAPKTVTSVPASVSATAPVVTARPSGTIQEPEREF